MLLENVQQVIKMKNYKEHITNRDARCQTSLEPNLFYPYTLKKDNTKKSQSYEVAFATKEKEQVTKAQIVL